MSTTENTAGGTVNYTAEQEAALTAAAPITWADANAFAEQWGKSAMSVVAKVKSLDLEYIAKPKPRKRPKGETKADIVSGIESHVGTSLPDGLEKATAAALRALRDALATIAVRHEAEAEAEE